MKKPIAGNLAKHHVVWPPSDPEFFMADRQSGLIAQVATAITGSAIEPAVVGIRLGIVRSWYPTEMANHPLNNE